MISKNLRRGNKYVPSILSGLLLGLSLPNFSYLPLGFLAWVWLIPLLLELRETENFRAFFAKTLIAFAMAFVTIMLW
jgi:apolipoprotein N-acyltransferase